MLAWCCSFHQTLCSSQLCSTNVQSWLGSYIFICWKTFYHRDSGKFFSQKIYAKCSMITMNALKGRFYSHMPLGNSEQAHALIFIFIWSMSSSGHVAQPTSYNKSLKFENIYVKTVYFIMYVMSHHVWFYIL